MKHGFVLESRFWDWVVATHQDRKNENEPGLIRAPKEMDEQGGTDFILYTKRGKVLFQLTLGDREHDTEAKVSKDRDKAFRYCRSKGIDYQSHVTLIFDEAIKSELNKPGSIAQRMLRIQAQLAQVLRQKGEYSLYVA